MNISWYISDYRNLTVDYWNLIVVTRPRATGVSGGRKLMMTTHLLVVSISLPLSRLVGVLASWIEKNKLGFGLWIQELGITGAWVLERGWIQRWRDKA